MLAGSTHVLKESDSTKHRMSLKIFDWINRSSMLARMLSAALLIGRSKFTHNPERCINASCGANIHKALLFAKPDRQWPQ